MANISTKNKEPGIRKEYIPSDSEQESIKRVYDRYYDMRDAREPFEKVWEAAIKNW